MEATDREQELRERLAISEDLFTINRDPELTGTVAKTVAEELRKEALSHPLFGTGVRAGGKRPMKRRHRARISNYTYYLQAMEENKNPLELIPPDTRFKTIKKVMLHIQRLTFQFQQLFNKATEDVLIVMTKDLKSLDMREQTLEDKIDFRIMDLLESQEEEIRELKETVKQLTEQQALLMEKLGMKAEKEDE